MSSAAQNTSNARSQPPRGVMAPQSTAMASALEIPLVPADHKILNHEDSDILPFESACRVGPVSTVQSIVSSRTCTPFFLYQGLEIALRAANVDIVSHLLSRGAPIIRQTPDLILSVPTDQQIPLFELLLQYGWTVNTPGYYGAVVLPRIISNLRLLHWFLAHGANPNLGEQRYSNDRYGGPDADSCCALEAAAGSGNVEAVRLLLDAGAVIENGDPLHLAAGAHPPGTNIYDGLIVPSKEFDESRIPTMTLLVQRGADVNQQWKSRHVMPRYPIVHAMMAGAVERVRWLIAYGADVELIKPNENALEAAYVQKVGSDEMRDVINGWLRAQK